MDGRVEVDKDQATKIDALASNFSSAGRVGDPSAETATDAALGEQPHSIVRNLESGFDSETSRRKLRRAMGIGLWVWPSFILLDAYMCLVLYPSAPFLLFLVYRAFVEAVLFQAYRESRRPDIPIEKISRLQNISFFLAALCIALMALHLGGTRSSYMHGISIVCLVRAAVLPEPWRSSFSTFAVLGLVFPMVMGGGAMISPAARAEWFSMQSLAVFFSNYVFVVASSLVGIVSGHAVWAAQQQVYRARRLGRYRLQAPIGRGGMGEVWLAWDQSLLRNVALKILRAAGPPDLDSVRRFVREAQSASRLREPHTIQVYDFGASDDGIYYIAMEYLPGADLNWLVRAYGPLPVARAVHFALQACLSLEAAHGLGIIHRDVKPQNLFVTRMGEEYDFLKLLDFGIARFGATASSDDLTRTGAMLGTPAFLSPELWQGAKADERSDIYALGATLYFLLTGSTPFESKNVGDLFRAHVHEQPVRPSIRLGDPIAVELEALILRCLAKSPAERFQSVGELRTALTRIHDQSGWTAAKAREFWQRIDIARPVWRDGDRTAE